MLTLTLLKLDWKLNYIQNISLFWFYFFPALQHRYKDQNMISLFATTSIVLLRRIEYIEEEYIMHKYFTSLCIFGGKIL